MGAPADVLRQFDIFAQLPESERGRIAKLMKERAVAKNHSLFRQGDPADMLYMIVKGRVKVSTTDQSGHEKVLAFLGEGEILGEMALMAGAPHSAAATASTDARLLQLRKRDFDAVLGKNTQLAREILRIVAARRSATHQRAFEEASADTARGWVTVVFSPRGGTGTTMLATNLAVALAQTTPDRVVLVDLDVLFGQTALMLNLSPRTSLAAVSPAALQQMDRENLNFYVTTHAESSLRVLIGALRPEDGELVTAEHVRTALAVLRRQFVHVVVDAARSFSEANLAALDSADEVLVVTTPEPGTLRAARESERVLAEMVRLPRERLKHVLNHPFPYKALSREQVQQLIERRLVGEIPFGGDAPARAALEGHPAVMKWPSNQVSRAIVALAQVVERTADEALALATG